MVSLRSNLLGNLDAEYGSISTGPSRDLAFEISDEDFVFAPQAYPEVVKISKERNKARNDNLCGNETVKDTGSKNFEILVSGYVPFSEKKALMTLVSMGKNLDLLSVEWSGEIQVLDGEWERYGHNTISYKLSLLSTGKDEDGRDVGDGIVSEGDV